MRTVLVLAGALGVLALYALMLRGWRNRQRRQAFLPAPATGPGTGDLVVDAVPGVFVGTTFAGHWLDRVAVHGLSDRSHAELTVTTDGVHLEREGASDVFVPFTSMDDVATTDALAGKVMGGDGLLALTWRLGETQVTSAFRADDRAQHPRLVDAMRALVAS